MASRFSEVELGPPIEVFALNKAFQEDAFDKKVSLGVGAYRTEAGKPWVLPVVRTAEKAIANDETLNKEYLPVLGLEVFTDVATRMLLGESNPALLENRGRDRRVWVVCHCGPEICGESDYRIGDKIKLDNHCFYT